MIDELEIAARIDDAGPASHARRTESAFPSGALLSTEGLGTAIRPRELLRSVVRGENNNGVVSDTQVIELLQKLPDDPIEFLLPAHPKQKRSAACAGLPV